MMNVGHLPLQQDQEAQYKVVWCLGRGWVRSARSSHCRQYLDMACLLATPKKPWIWFNQHCILQQWRLVTMVAGDT